jgi:integrase
MRSNEPRIYGPYEHGDQFRLHVVTGSGRGRKTTYRSYPTRDLAEAALRGARSQAQGVTVRAAATAFIKSMRTAGLAESTVTTNEFRLWHILQVPRNGERPLRWIAHRGQSLYDAAQVERAADTHQAELGLARQFGEFCVKQKWMKANPFWGIDPVGRKTHGSTKPRLRVDESRTLREYCLSLGINQHAIITFAYLLMGARASELVKRDVRDLDDNGSLLWINRTKTIAGTRRLRVPDELRLLMLELAKGKGPNDPIFTLDNGKRADRHWAYRIVKRICNEAKVPPLSPQALRRTQSDIATEAGETAIAVARHLGQTSSAVTDRSYRDRDVVSDAKTDRAFKVIAGGLS